MDGCVNPSFQHGLLPYCFSCSRETKPDATPQLPDSSSLDKLLLLLLTGYRFEHHKAKVLATVQVGVYFMFRRDPDCGHYVRINRLKNQHYFC